MACLLQDLAVLSTTAVDLASCKEKVSTELTSQ
jgi:hypothetical protein